MKNIFLSFLQCLLIAGIANIMIPPGKCEKQIRFLCGIMFVSNILGIFIESDTSLSEASRVLRYDIPSWEYESVSEDFSGYIFSEYSASLKTDMQEKLYEDSGITALIEISITEDENSKNYGDISSVTVSVSDEEEFIKAKKFINSFYKVSNEHIHMHIKEE